MYESLNLQVIRDVCPEFLQFLHRKLSRGDHPACALAVPEVIRAVVCIVRLRTDMPVDFRTYLLRDIKHTRICNDQSIRLHTFKLLKIFSYFREITVMRQDIRCHIHLHIAGMGKLDPLPHLFHRKILCFGAEPERFSSDVYCIRPEDHRRLQHFQAARRYQ